MSQGVHVHHCPTCGREWDCSNACGVVDGSLSKAICGLCTEYVIALDVRGFSKGACVVAAKEKMPHMHVCIINDHMWECLDVTCGFETMMNLENMRHLECPACFVFTS